MEQHFYTLCALALECASEKKSYGNFGISKNLYQAQFTTLRFFIVLNKSFPLSFAWRDHTRAWQNCKCSKLAYDKWLNAHFNTIQVA